MDISLSKLWELVMVTEAWHAAVHGVAKSWTRLSNWTELSSEKSCICLCQVLGLLLILSHFKASLTLSTQVIWKLAIFPWGLFHFLVILSYLCFVFSCSVKCDSLWHPPAPHRPWTVAQQAPLSMGILQARILEWIAVPFSRGSSRPRDQTHVSCTPGKFFTVWATRETPK